MKKILINLKDWLNYSENLDYAIKIEGMNITVFPSLPYLYLYKNRGVRIGSQKISSFEEGPHTGSISANHLKDFDVEAVILNHKECQIDSVSNLIAKIKNAQSHNIEVIICVGSNEEKELSKIKEVLNETGTSNSVVAYEPFEEIRLDEIVCRLNSIKDNFKNYDLTYLYGGNVTYINIAKFIKELNVDGYLISSHALDIENLKRILNIVETAENS